MVLESAWLFVIALGFGLAFISLPWIMRYPATLSWRHLGFVGSQLILLTSLIFPSESLLRWFLPSLCLLPLLALSEQMRFLCQPTEQDQIYMRWYQYTVAASLVLNLVLPNLAAFSLSILLSITTFLIVAWVIHHKTLYDRRHMIALLVCTLFISINHSFILILGYKGNSSLLAVLIITLCICASLISNLFGQESFRHFVEIEEKSPDEPSSPPPRDINNQQLSELSHDMRTPLSGILGMSELLLETSLNMTQRDYVQTIQSSGNTLLHLINDRLDNPQAAEQELIILEEAFDVTELLHYCLDMFKTQAEDKNIELISYLDSSLPKQILGDAVRLRQILSRLLHNAIRFTQSGEVIISIKYVTLGKQLGIQFSVQDTGVGMSESDINAALQAKPIQQSRHTWHIAPELNACAQILQMMGGELHIDSIPHQGTTVSFNLPLKSPNTGFNDSTTEFIASFAGKRLLVVDDNLTVTKLLAEQATQWGMRVSYATSGAEALAVARNAANLGQAFDVIIMDYQMPGMSGLQLAVRLKEDTLITNDVILLMLTGLRQNNIQTLARNAGIHRVITKPITNKSLRQIISQELKRQQEIQQNLKQPERQLDHLHVLIAEDNQLGQKVIHGMMQKLGVNHTIVNNGQEAVQAVMNNKFDIILMDCDMPIMDGYTATQEIRRWEKKGLRSATPILALTAHILEEHKQKALNAGMNKHLSKPVELGELQNALLEFCS